MGDDAKPPSQPFWHRHRHQWNTIAESYQRGPDEYEVGPARARGAGAAEAMRAQKELLERLAYGLTTVTQRCSCGQQRSYIVTGDARTTSVDKGSSDE